MFEKASESTPDALLIAHLTNVLVRKFEFMRTPGTKPVCYLPVCGRQGTFGALGVARWADGALNSLEGDLLMQVAWRVGVPFDGRDFGSWRGHRGRVSPARPECQMQKENEYV
jgi:hypothetical protein